MEAHLLGKIANYLEILAKDSRSTVFVPLSECYRRMGLLDDALEVAQKGVAALPRFSPGLAALGRILAQREEWEKAGDAFEKALTLDSENLAALKGLAKVRLRTGHREDARNLLQRAAALQPDDAGLRKVLSQLESKDNSPPSSNSSPPLRSDGQPFSTVTIAEIYLRQGYLKRAAKVYRDLLRSEPDNDDLRRKLTELKQRIAQEESGGQPKNEAPEPGTVAPMSAARTTPAFSDSGSSDGSSKEADRQIDELNRWLEAIRNRRDHV